MKTIYYSCKEKQELVDTFSSIADLTDKTNYDDWNISIDIIGKVNTTPSVYDGEGNLLEEKEPVYTDFLFNIIYVTDKYKELFEDFKEEAPETPYRQFA